MISVRIGSKGSSMELSFFVQKSVSKFAGWQNEEEDNIMTDKVKEIISQLEDGVEAVFTSENYIRLLNMLAQFHSYSYNNCILILMQCPSATRVASFQTWKKMGYPVKKGEKGIRILVPIPYTYQKEQKSVDEQGNSVLETVDAKGLTFRVGNVFDASQVVGELPTLAHELTDDSAFLQEAVKQLVNKSENINYDHNLKKGEANGYYRTDTQEIYLRTGMAAMQTLKTIIHEKAHSVLHSASDGYSREEAEVQAESVAYCVASAFGLDTSDYSFGYIAGWSSNRETKELKSSLAVIEKTARELMNWLASSTDLELLVPA